MNIVIKKNSHNHVIVREADNKLIEFRGVNLLHDLLDVNVDNVENNDVIIYDQETSKYIVRKLVPQDLGDGNLDGGIF